MNADYYNNLGNSLQTNGDLESAILNYQMAIKIDPSFSSGYNNMGIAYMSLGQNQKALISIKKAIKINPDFMDAYYNVGLTYRSLKNYEKAIEAFEKECKKDISKLAPDDEKKFSVMLEAHKAELTNS